MPINAMKTPQGSGGRHHRRVVQRSGARHRRRMVHRTAAEMLQRSGAGEWCTTPQKIGWQHRTLRPRKLVGDLKRCTITMRVTVRLFISYHDPAAKFPVILTSKPTLEPSSDRMCDHNRVIYGCGCSIYVVKGWCDKYALSHKPCGAHPITMLVSITFTMRGYSVTDTILAERSDQTSYAVGYFIWWYEGTNSDGRAGLCREKLYQQKWLAANAAGKKN